MDGCVTAACRAALMPQHCRPCFPARSTKWPTRIVAVVAAYDRPRQQFQNSSTVTFVIYQRLRPAEPNYSPNIGAEGGVHIQFILDHYNDLPLQTVFMTDDHNRHNHRIVDWMACLKPEVNYVPFTMNRLRQTGPWMGEAAPRAALVEQCWRNILDVFGASAAAVEPRVPPRVAYYQGSYFMASRAQLWRHPRSTYARAHALFAGGDGRCHAGELDWARLSTNRTAETIAVDTPELTKHTHGSAWEVWEHVLIGGMHAVAPYKFDYCQGFEPQSKCPHSPCRPGAAWMGRSKDEYYMSWTANTATTCCELADAAVPCCKDRMSA